MPDSLPFPIPVRLPRKITPCPILEAIMEIRFVPKRPWEHFPGLFADKFGHKYPIEEDIGMAKLPQIVREQDPRLIHVPYRRYIGDQFTLQVGPRVVGLITKNGMYPGWDVFWPAMEEIIKGVHELGIMREASRLGLRYINFFPFNIFDQLTLGLSVNGTALKNPETGLNTVFVHEGFRHFVQINNASMIGDTGNKTRFGSILDIDTAPIKAITDINLEAESLFRSAHVAEKKVFFGL